MKLYLLLHRISIRLTLTHSLCFCSFLGRKRVNFVVLNISKQFTPLGNHVNPSHTNSTFERIHLIRSSVLSISELYFPIIHPRIITLSPQFRSHKVEFSKTSLIPIVLNSLFYCYSSGCSLIFKVYMWHRWMKGHQSFSTSRNTESKLFSYSLHSHY